MAKISFRYAGREVEGGIPCVTIKRLVSEGFGDLANTTPYAALRTEYGTLRTNELWRLVHAVSGTKYANPEANVGFTYTFDFKLS